MTRTRRFSLLALSLFSTTAVADVRAKRSAPAPTTQACLGDRDAFLACPAGAARWGTECRAMEPHRGEGAGEHWSGSKRQGPALFLRDDDELDPAKIRVSFAAAYKDHKKSGRVFRFDADGVLESWSDVDADLYHGLSVTCHPDGTVWHLGYFERDRLVRSRAWKTDGSFSYAFEYDVDGKSRGLAPTPELASRPDELCRPSRCDVHAKPDLATIDP